MASAQKPPQNKQKLDTTLMQEQLKNYRVTCFLDCFIIAKID